MRHHWHRRLVIIACVSLSIPSLSPSWAQRPTVAIAAGGYAGEVAIALNKSKVLELDRAFDSASVANPDIADIVPLSSRSVYVFGQALGSTSLTLTGADGDVLAVVDVAVTYDVDRLRRHLYRTFPDERVAIRPTDAGIVLDGAVSNATRLDDILAIAQRYAPDAVTNLLTVTRNRQVMLHVRFAEMQRQLVKQLGVNLGAVFDDGTSVFSFNSGDGASVDPLAFATGAFGLTSGNWNIDALIDVLEQKGIVRLLAEPNLISRSGDTASFLAGGEFPVPVSSETSGGFAEISVEFKEFGIGLSFTPTVVGDDLINLELFTEVSDIDESNSVSTGQGLQIPGLTVRRANTTIELRTGQSFAIAGLLSDEFRDNVRQVPGAGDVPVLGSLFRSSGYQSNQTELVVIVTPHLVRPATPDALKTPLENYVPPDEVDLFLRGEVGRRTGAAAGHTLGVSASGGIAGPHGYILE